MKPDNISEEYIENLPEGIQKEIEYILYESGLSKEEVNYVLTGTIGELSEYIEIGELSYIYGLIDAIIEDDIDNIFPTDGTLIDDYGDIPEYDIFGDPVVDLIPDADRNVINIDFSPSGARYTLSGTFEGEDFSYTFGGQGETVLEMVWNALQKLSVKYDIIELDEYLFDDIYVNGNKVNIDDAVDAHYNSEVEDEQTVAFEPDFDEPEEDD